MADTQAAAGHGRWLELENKVCVVTGAASGIGLALAQALCGVGARVALWDRDAERVAEAAQALKASAGKALALPCDTADEASVLHAAQAVRERLGPAQVLINNAGLLRAGSLSSISLADWNHVLAVNLTGYLLCARSLAPQMREHGMGSMVHVASISASYPQSHSGAYSASKAGVLLLSRQLAVEWAGQGIRSNAVCPGMIRTALSQPFYQQPGVEAARSAATASRRIGEPVDIANAALFLASPRSAYVNGAELSVDGGMPSMLMDLVPRPGFNMGAAGTQPAVPAR